VKSRKAIELFPGRSMKVTTIHSDHSLEAPTIPWSRSLWFNLFFCFFASSSVIIGIISDAPLCYTLGQFFFSISAYCSFCILSDRPLFNPIQAFVAIFYWWFSVCPSVGGGFYLLLGLPDKALKAQVSGMESLWVVAAGLPLYAIAARHTLVLMAEKAVYAHFLLPEGQNYTKKTMILFFSVGFSAQAALLLCSNLGIAGQESTNYLGGVKTTIWWVGIIAGIVPMVNLTSSVLVTELIKPWKSIDVSVKAISFIIIAQTMYGALTSGWKGHFVFLVFFIMCAYISKHQSLPWRSLLLFMLVYLLIIEPFVATGRHLAELDSVTTVSEKRDVFLNLIENGGLNNKRAIHDINIESPFRGIYPLAGDITRNNTLFDGEWAGKTVEWGLSVLVPRVMNPEKPDMNIGNFFYKTTYSRSANEVVHGDLTNVSISLPFEFVGNYGWGIGVMSFFFIGIFWASFCGWVLSVPRLSYHPFSPYVIGMTLGVEAPLGHFLATLRGFIVLLLVIFAIRKLVRHSL
jgi:hypothetical protein